jgi:hypothetical protein
MRAYASVAALAATCLLAVPAVAREDARAVLARVRGYVASYDRQLVALIADEHYVQTDSVASAQSTPAGRSRVLDSEFGWVWLPVLQDTIGVREVRRVDGRPVAGGSRLRQLLERPPADASAEVRAILAESATHNIGEVRRNINFPTFALTYLRHPRERDTRWRAVRLGNHVDLHFEERDRSTLVRSADGTRTPARGRFSVDPDSGRIAACELRVRIGGSGSSGRTSYWMLVTFAPEPRLGLWVPVRMLERHYRNGREQTLGGEISEATYGNYRRYEGSGRLVK